MTQDIMTTIGEEWYTESNLGDYTITLGVYNDATSGSNFSGDRIDESYDIADITTEPTNAYSRANTTTQPEKHSGDWGFSNAFDVTFDFSNTSATHWVDTYLLLAGFESSEAGDSGTTLHLMANPSMKTNRDIGSIDSLTIAPGQLHVTID